MKLKTIFKNSSIFFRDWRRWHKKSKFLLICLISSILTITVVAPTAGQIPLFSQSSNNQSYSTPWWDLHKAKTCGKYWCSQIFLHAGKPWQIFENMTVAFQGGSDEPPAEVALKIEERARLVQRSLLQIVRIAVNSPKMAQVKAERDWKYLLPTTKKPLHPATPKVEVGIENKQIVVYVPAQPELGLSQETIITVNRADARVNGQSRSKLAKTWRDLNRRHLSEKLWGYELDTNYPWLRTLGAILIAIVTLSIILASGLISHLLKQLERQIRRRLSRLTQSLTLNPESASVEKLAELEQLTTLDTVDSSIAKETSTDTAADPSSVSVGPSSSMNSKTPVAPGSGEIAVATATSDRLNKIDIFNIWHQALAIGQILSTQMQTFGRILPKTSLGLIAPLKQVQNLIQLLNRLLFSGQIFIFSIGVTLILLLFPASRFYFRLFFVQAIFLPLTWMSIGILDKISDILIDYYLNQWALNAQLNAPHSNRSALRASTYSRALKKATTIIFVAIGIYITILLLGIDPAMLAGAGVAAVILALLSRNLLENMLNGILILATDRYALGDVIQVNGMGGCVENMNLYATSLRNLDGQLIVIPNSEIGTVINMTKDWSQVNFSIKIAYNSDLNKAKTILQQIAEQMNGEAEWGDKILEPAIILGVDEVSHEGILIRMLIKTLPGQHWSVGREFRARVQPKLIEAGISFGVPQRAVWQLQQPPNS